MAYATPNNNSENASSPSDGKEHRRTRDITDTNQSSSSSSSSQSSFVPTSNGGSNNASQPGTLLVTKQVINEGGGEAEPSDFTITVDGNNPTPSSFDGSSSGTSIQLFEGRYQVTESGPNTNYSSTLSKECSGNIREGESKRCTITNTYSEPPPPDTTATIIVTKKVVNEGGGDKKPSDFTITVDGNNPTPSSFDGSSSGTTITINEGSYNVTEEGSDVSYDYVPGKYTPSYSSNCAGEIQAGDTVRCTVTNKYNQFIPGILPKLIVTKQVINEGGGEAEPSDFTITVDGNNPTPSSFDGSSSGTSVTLEPGSYSVTENSLPEYTSSKSGECAGSLSAGETKQCTITNIYQPIDKSAQLIVINNVIDDDDDGSELTVKPSAFIITVHGNDPLPRSFPGKSGEGVIVNLNQGRYSVTADGPDGYTSDYSEGCEGTIRAGDAKACIITNEDITPPSLIPPKPPQPLPTIETITGFSAPYGITLNPDNDLMYVSNYGQFNTTGTVSVINGTTNTIVANVPVGKNPQAIVYNPANGLVYAANTLSNTLSIINGTSNSLVGSIIVDAFPGKNPTGITINPINNIIYVTNMGSNTVSVINGTTNVVVKNITLATVKQEAGAGAGGTSFFSPAGIAYNSDNGNLYVTNRGSDSISVINGTTNTLVDEISVNSIAPSSITYNAANNYIYVTNMGSNTVSVINGTTNTIVANIPVGLGPNGIAYNQNNGDVYVANSINGTISIVDGLENTVTSTIPLGINNNPNDIFYNVDNDRLFVTNTNSSTVSAIEN
ncbi:MAG TPA: beta-propeller fold lactonase family protein [Nitrososphaeraceae archaeon]|nr:beta-propeller fold lactonase family protein [Nitrososphaeraceae archaeon]